MSLLPVDTAQHKCLPKAPTASRSTQPTEPPHTDFKTFPRLADTEDMACVVQYVAGEGVQAVGTVGWLQPLGSGNVQ